MKIKSKLLLFALGLLSISSCDDTYSQGQRIYTALCANCHMDDGSGLNQLIPRLKGSLYLTGQKQGLVCVIRQGFRADSLGLTLKYMPAHPKITDVEMTNLVNYLSRSFGNSKYFKLEDIRNINCIN
ncbi:MAG TPA: cytochrome c [Saprospiraceae bacterium]|nr:cytochrome c [Saprospiraceae bacterium]